MACKYFEIIIGNKMAKSKKNLIKESLKSNDKQLIITAIEDIVEHGDKEILILAIELFCTTNDAEIKSHILSLLFNLKNPEAADVLFSFIADKAYHDQLNDLLIACWECGLDFSIHIEALTNLVISEPFETAFEAVTVIENIDAKLDTELLDKCIAALQKSIKRAGADKKALLESLVVTLKNFKLGTFTEHFSEN